VCFVTPNGFQVVLYKIELVPVIAKLSDPGIKNFLFSDGTRVERVDKTVPALYCLDTDVWENEGFRHGMYICDVCDFVYAIARYIQTQWPTI
jgi:hypothetical protein